MDEAGCVFCSLAAAGVVCAGRDLNPGSALAKLRDVLGCFVGDELVIPIAAPVLGLEAGPLIVNADDIKRALRENLSPTSAVMLRVKVKRDSDGHESGHTVLAVQRADTIVECYDSACPAQDGVREGWCAIDLASLCNASLLRWNKDVRTYSVQAARRLWKAGA